MLYSCACVCVHCRCVFFPEITRRAKSRSRRIAFSHFHTPRRRPLSRQLSVYIRTKASWTKRVGVGRKSFFPKVPLFWSSKSGVGLKQKVRPRRKSVDKTQVSHTQNSEGREPLLPPTTTGRAWPGHARARHLLRSMYLCERRVLRGLSFGERDQPTSTASRGGKPAKGKQLRLYWCKTG